MTERQKEITRLASFGRNKEKKWNIHHARSELSLLQGSFFFVRFHMERPVGGDGIYHLFICNFIADTIITLLNLTYIPSCK